MHNLSQSCIINIRFISEQALAYVGFRDLTPITSNAQFITAIRHQLLLYFRAGSCIGQFSWLLRQALSSSPSLVHAFRDWRSKAVRVTWRRPGYKHGLRPTHPRSRGDSTQITPLWETARRCEGIARLVSPLVPVQTAKWVSDFSPITEDLKPRLSWETIPAQLN